MPRPRAPRLSAPYLRRVWLDEARVAHRVSDPFNLTIFQDGFDLEFDRAVTILIGEDSVGKSTLLEAVAALAGYEEVGRIRRSIEASRVASARAERLAGALRATWLPKMTQGWFFRAESFFSLGRLLEEPPYASDSTLRDLPSHSHGGDFLRLVEERRQGVYIFDEPESVLSPTRQIEFLKLLRRMESFCQVIMTTHSPLLMAYPGARLLRLSERGARAVTLDATDQYRLFLSFCTNPREFARNSIEE